MLFQRVYSDEEIVEGLRQGGVEANIYIRYLYRKHVTLIIKLVTDNTGTEEEARDVFQDALVIFYEQVRRETFSLKAKISTYLYAVARNLWLNTLKKRKLAHKFQLIQEKEGVGVEESPMVGVLSKEREWIVKQAMEELKEDCRKILILSVFEHLPMKEIYQKMGFQNEQIARNKKHKCLKYLKKIVLRNFSMADVAD
ncbi:MAG: sigma-70 family RNA polymerase sigma factor [Bacteroidota bacterium]